MGPRVPLALLPFAISINEVFKHIDTLYIPGFLLFCSVLNISIYSNILQTIPITTCVNPMIILSCMTALGATKIC